ncbi:glycosyltransferase family 39 protein [Phenylobacterium sp.]|uniref:glycosyltransferase family 39 protein n=1 Tax=Phenylobacterium sp. TaxID=1871053 RepID=UPI00273530D5|nr:glycosyltransferase family 39 protein [Phenylobacterium sp.]MDP3659108.1 hypothetical protein [Phenylobacterium sp.]
MHGNPYTISPHWHYDAFTLSGLIFPLVISSARAAMNRSHCWALSLVFGVGGLAAVGQAFTPIAEFVHRGDDAYYYFKVAVNYARLGFWSFDGLEPTNGVQPLWALLLSGLAVVSSWVGVTDVATLARLFVLLAALVHVAGAVLLYRLLAKQVSFLTGLAAAGAWLFAPSFVWGRLWGMESPLLALMLIAALGYHQLHVRNGGSLRNAAILGVLLGLVCLSRLNAGLFIPVLLAAHLLDRHAGSFATRFRQAFVAGLAASAVVAPYLAWNVATTGALLPVSGVVKTLGVQAQLAQWAGGEPAGLGKRASFIFYHWREALRWFVTSRLLDGFWITGLRLFREGATSWAPAFAVVALALGGPALLGRPIEWLRFLGARIVRMAPFWPVAAFAIIDAMVSVGVYPTQVYAITRWWLVSAEICLIVTGALLAAAAIEYSAARVGPKLPGGLLARGGLVALALLIVAHAWQHAHYFWTGAQVRRDWNLSWNDESYRAAQWINANLSKDAIVGSWNAGVVGFYAQRRVVNLDGLINNAALVPFLKDDRTDLYILDRKIQYLSDLDGHGFIARKVAHRLKLTPVYRHHSTFMHADYVIYRVDGPAEPGPR